MLVFMYPSKYNIVKMSRNKFYVTFNNFSNSANGFENGLNGFGKVQ